MKHGTGRFGGDVRGQSAVEFALVLPVFLLILIALIEFAFAFSTLNSLNYTARDVALTAAEGGDRSGTDCTALQVLERELGQASNPGGVIAVEIYWSDQNGTLLSGQVNRYNRSGSLNCTGLDGVARTLPYTAAGSTYPESIRCNVLNGASCVAGHTRLDTIGVRVTYAYGWKTPLGALLGGIGSPLFAATQQMQMEPVL